MIALPPVKRGVKNSEKRGAVTAWGRRVKSRIIPKIFF